jgi:hypothetical protein
MSEVDGAPKSLSGPTFFLSSEYGEVKKALYFPVLPAQHSLKDLEEHLVVVVSALQWRRPDPSQDGGSPPRMGRTTHWCRRNPMTVLTRVGLHHRHFVALQQEARHRRGCLTAC